MRMNRTWKQALFAYVNLGKKRVKSKTKEGSFMKKKWMESALAVTLACTMFAGCGQSAQTTADGESVSADLAASGTETAADGTEAEADNGKVTLTVWAEEANFPVLQEMIDSFEQKYAGQADFDIQLVESADAETRNNLLGDIHNGADVFPLPDDQLSSMVAAGALEPVPNAD